MELSEEGRQVSTSRLSRILGVPRSTVYYSRRQRRPRRLDESLAGRIWQTIQEFPAWGIRKVWAYLKHVVGMTVNRKGDLIDAQLMRVDRQTLEEKLETVGLLLGSTRVLDMSLRDGSQVNKMVEKFLHGIYDLSPLGRK